jgi:transposase InsO family protein
VGGRAEKDQHPLAPRRTADPTRTMASEWAFARYYPNERTRRSALTAWLHTYNHHRQHSAIDKVPPITRLTNLPGQYS